MKKFLFTFLAVSVLFQTATFAEKTSDLVIKKGVEIDVDGKANEPIWAHVDPISISNKFNNEEATVTAFYKMFYTDEYLYLLIDVTDDLHYPSWVSESKEHWMFDKIEVYFDVNDVLKDGNGPAYTNGYMAPGHYQFAPTFEEAAYDIPYLPQNVLYGSLSNEVYICYSLKADNKSYTIEYEFPLYAFKNDRDESMDINKLKALPNGLGFDIIVVDNDNDGASRKRAVWKNIGPTEPYVNMDNCGVITFGNEILPSGLSSPKTTTVKVFPNPVTEELTIEGNFDRVLISNMAGQEMKVSNTSRKVDVRDLSKGIYILKTFENGICNGVAKITKE